MLSSGVNLFVVVLTVLNTAAAVLLLVWMRKRRGESQRTEDTTGHVWDGDLKEYNNPLPRWWLWLFVLSVVFSIAYAFLYPTLGNSRGSLGWTQIKQWEELQAEQEKQAQVILAKFADRAPDELAGDPQAVAIGRNLFANNCAACHGSDGRGGAGFPNLTDGDWLYGGQPETILATLNYGRNGVMPPWGDALGEQGVEEVVAYVLTLSGQSAPADLAAAGQGKFQMF
ncbi:MAG: cbb3-type cytochrome c oxidase N-terminal domain-containing protein, partial [Steroidobacteraceae bacterium]